MVHGRTPRCSLRQILLCELRTMPQHGAVSIGHGDTMLRDQLLEDLDWFSPVQRLAWSAIQFRRYFIKFLLAVQGQVGAFREVLPKQPVRVLVGAALPRRVRAAKYTGRPVRNAKFA